MRSGDERAHLVGTVIIITRVASRCWCVCALAVLCVPSVGLLVCVRGPAVKGVGGAGFGACVRVRACVDEWFARTGVRTRRGLCV